MQNDKLNFEHNPINYVVTKKILNKTLSFCIYLFKHTCMTVNQYLRYRNEITRLTCLSGFSFSSSNVLVAFSAEYCLWVVASAVVIERVTGWLEVEREV